MYQYWDSSKETENLVAGSILDEDYTTEGVL